MTSGPDPRASLRGFLALVLDMVRVDPDRRPSAELQRWYQEIAIALNVAPEHARTNRALFERALRLQWTAFGEDAELPENVRAELAAHAVAMEEVGG